MTALTAAERTLVRRLLLIQYGQRVPPRSPSFVWPSDAALLAVQEHIFDDLVSRRAPLLPATPAYEKAFLKVLVTKLQDAINDAQAQDLPGSADLEIEERLLEQYTDSMTSAEQTGPPPTSLKTYLVPPPQPLEPEGDPTSAELLAGWTRIVMREEGSFVSEGTTGLQTWEASLRLAEHILADASAMLAPGTRVLEVGAGAGFLSALCAKCLAGKDGDGVVYATDVASTVLDRLEETRLRNGIPPEALQPRALDWLQLLASDAHDTASSEALALLDEARPSLVLAADVVFDPHLMPALAATLRRAIEAGGKEARHALVASTIRNPDTYQTFLAALDAAGIRAEVQVPARLTALRIPASLLHAAHGTDVREFHCFPTAHIPERDGRVEMLALSVR